MSTPAVGERVAGFRDVWGGSRYYLAPYSGVVIGYSRGGLPVVELDDNGGFIELDLTPPVVARPQDSMTHEH